MKTRTRLKGWPALGGMLALAAAALLAAVLAPGAARAEEERVTLVKAVVNGHTVTYETDDVTADVVGSSDDEVTWGNTWYVVKDREVNISKRITVVGKTCLILCDGATLNANEGIKVSKGSILEIHGQSGGTGTLAACGSDYDSSKAAGIGGNGGEDGGIILIHGGTVKASGGDYGAGIGGGWFASGGDVYVYGGTVTATGGATGGAGIGGGEWGGNGDDVYVYGGTVTATGGNNAAGIGGGEGGGNGGNVHVYGGTVTATGGCYGGAGIGGGPADFQGGGNGGTLEVYGGTVTAKGGSGTVYALDDICCTGAGAGVGGGGGQYYRNFSSTGPYDYASSAGGLGAEVTIYGGTVKATGGDKGESQGGYSAPAGVGIGGGGGVYDPRNNPATDSWSLSMPIAAAGDDNILKICSGRYLYGSADEDLSADENAHAHLLSDATDSYTGYRFQYMVENGNKPVFPDGADAVQMWRLYNPNSGEHFYTASTGERDLLMAAGWRDDGEAWVAPVFSGAPVFRLYNRNGGDHHYTLSAGERDLLVAAGWRDEGVGWYSDAQGHVPVYRAYNPNARTGAHHFTTSAGEIGSLVAAGWRDEGVGWYAVR